MSELFNAQREVLLLRDLVKDLWLFIENGDDDSIASTDKFFELRERVRDMYTETEEQSK